MVLLRFFFIITTFSLIRLSLALDTEGKTLIYLLQMESRENRNLYHVDITEKYEELKNRDIVLYCFYRTEKRLYTMGTGHHLPVPWEQNPFRHNLPAFTWIDYWPIKDSSQLDESLFDFLTPHEEEIGKLKVFDDYYFSSTIPFIAQENNLYLEAGNKWFLTSEKTYKEVLEPARSTNPNSSNKIIYPARKNSLQVEVIDYPKKYEEEENPVLFFEMKVGELPLRNLYCGYDETI